MKIGRITIPLTIALSLLVSAWPGATATAATAQAMGAWRLTGRMLMPRYFYAEALLPTGQVFVVGGFAHINGALSTTERYDPVQGTWSAAATLRVARAEPQATLLTNGDVLVAGGDVQRGADAGLYDPQSDTFSPTGRLHQGRYFFTATRLPSGRVLVTGGEGGTSRLFTRASAEIYDPATGTWTPTGRMAVARQDQTATLLPDGTVLIAGGSANRGATALSSAELYNPATGTFTATGSMAGARLDHTATLLPSGAVLVTGGSPCFGCPSLASAELYHPDTGTWTSAGTMSVGRTEHTATLLATGQVLVAGGATSTYGTALASAELYDPASGTWTAAASMNRPRYLFAATLLPNGQVLVAGGSGNGGQCPCAIASAELYTPAP